MATMAFFNRLFGEPLWKGELMHLTQRKLGYFFLQHAADIIVAVRKHAAMATRHDSAPAGKGGQ